MLSSTIVIVVSPVRSKLLCLHLLLSLPRAARGDKQPESSRMPKTVRKLGARLPARTL